ncbi:hypothetical protein [Altererythrobacter sp. ZODW24]|uniref:hypothetical protein n=1 Tax=Altererythrobacter sp. ZODW24 TaxID=2185142 RepID=UPI000DF7AC26|nr:hypothetical protein [Altererythrobacter sp. ZODW24]
MTGETNSKPAGRSPAFYGGLLAASVATISGLRLSDAIDSTTGFILFAGAMLLMIPLARAMTRKQRNCGTISPAIATYTKGIMITSFAYIVGLGIAVSMNNRMELTGITAFLIALLPVIPILGMVYVMGKYLIDEKDEYLRHRAMIANVVGLGAVLSIGSFWGFLETFEIVPHVPGWWSVPIWAIGMGFAQGWMSLRDRTPAEDEA